MQFSKLQEFIRISAFTIFLSLFTFTSYSTPTEEDLKKISQEIYDIAIQVKSAFESGDLQGACEIAYSILNKWENIDPNQLDLELVDKYYLLNSLVEQNKARLNEVCLIENSMNP